MVYEFKCPLCDKCVEVECSMSEISNLSDEKKQTLQCPGFGVCEHIEEKDIELSKNLKFLRNYTVNFLKFDSMSPLEKQNVLKERSKQDYKKNIEERKQSLQGTAISQLKQTFK